MNVVRITFILYLFVLYITTFLAWGGYNLYPIGVQIYYAMLIGMYVLYPLHLFFFIYRYKAIKPSPFLFLYYFMNIATLIYVAGFSFIMYLFSHKYE